MERLSVVLTVIAAVLCGDCLGRAVVVTAPTADFTSDSVPLRQAAPVVLADSPRSNMVVTSSGQGSIGVSTPYLHLEQSPVSTDITTISKPDSGSGQINLTRTYFNSGQDTHSKSSSIPPSSLSTERSRSSQDIRGSPVPELHAETSNGQNASLLSLLTTTPTAPISYADKLDTQQGNNDPATQSVREVDRPTRNSSPWDTDILIQKILREVHLYTSAMLGRHDREGNYGHASHSNYGRDGNFYDDNDASLSDSDRNDDDNNDNNGDDQNSNHNNRGGDDNIEEEDDSNDAIPPHDQLVDVILKDSSYTDQSLRQDLANMSHESLINLLHELSRLRSSANMATSTASFTDSRATQQQQQQHQDQRTNILSSLSLGDVCCSIG